MPKVTDAMVDQFLGWSVPFSACADPCATKQQDGRSGTNFFSADEARQMLEHVLALTPRPAPEMGVQRFVERDGRLHVETKDDSPVQERWISSHDYDAVATQLAAANAKLLAEETEHNETMEKLAAANAEIERLREENEYLRADCGVRQIEGYQKGKAEITIQLEAQEVQMNAVRYRANAAESRAAELKEDLNKAQTKVQEFDRVNELRIEALSRAAAAEAALGDANSLWCEAIINVQDSSSGRLTCDAEKLLAYVNARKSRHPAPGEGKG